MRLTRNEQGFLMLLVAAMLVGSLILFLQQPPAVQADNAKELAASSAVKASTIAPVISAASASSSPTPVLVPVAAPKLVRIHVAGAVRKPGLVRVPADACWYDAIMKAGGPRADADQDAINLAAPVREGLKIYLPAKSKHPVAQAPVVTSPTITRSTAPSVSTVVNGKLNLNTATEQDLEGLDGIGPVLANRILEYRKTHGGFKSVDDLRAVQGIGAKRFETLKDKVMVR